MKKETIIKISINLFSAFILVGLFSHSVFALPGGAGAGQIDNPLGNNNSLSKFFDNIVGVALELGTILSVLAVMYGGFLYVTAQGDEEKLGKAYKTITWALVGTAILLGARTISAAIVDTMKQLSTN